MVEAFQLQMNEYLPLRDVVFQTLRQAILRGELKPGERLMEIHLAQKLGVSRTPVREAIRKLELEGLVLMIPRKGAVVAEITVSDLEDVLECVRRLKPVSPDSVFLFGGSQGGLVSALTAASHPEAVKGMILYYPAFCIPDDWEKKYSSQEKIPDTIEFWGMSLGKIYALDARRIRPFQTIGRFDKEVLIVHGDQDDVVPLQYSRKALERYKEARLEVLQGEGHGYSPAGSRKAAEMALRFMLKLQKNHR